MLRGSRAFEIASHAVTLDPSTRDGYLQEVCRADASLRESVERLLTDVEDDSFALRSPWEPIESVADDQEFEGTDRFQVRRRLGAGAFGTVYEVWDHQERQRVALKLLRQMKPAFLLRFKREFRSLTNVKAHRNIVRLHELFGDQRQWFFTMEMVEGSNF